MAFRGNHGAKELKNGGAGTRDHGHSEFGRKRNPGWPNDFELRSCLDTVTDLAVAWDLLSLLGPNVFAIFLNIQPVPQLGDVQLVRRKSGRGGACQHYAAG